MALLNRRRQSLFYLYIFATINLVWCLFLFFPLAIGICTCRISYWWILNSWVFLTEIYLDNFPVSIQILSRPLAFSHEIYHQDDLCSIRGTINFCTPYYHVWDENNLRKIFPLAPSQLSHMPHIYPLHFQKLLTSSNFKRPLISKWNNKANG